MITFGLTGGIATGKSTVEKTFISHGIPIVDADIVARQVVEPGTYGLLKIVEIFGPDTLFPNGTLNRSKLSEMVFDCLPEDVRQNNMHMLNNLMGPLIREEGARQIKKLHDHGRGIVGWSAALICEMGQAEHYRPLIVVSCPVEMQVERLIKRSGLTTDQAMSRINAQMPTQQKTALADYVISSDGTIEESIKQTEIYIEILKSIK